MEHVSESRKLDLCKCAKRQPSGERLRRVNIRRNAAGVGRGGGEGVGGGRVIGGSTVGRHHRRPTRTIIYGQARAMLRAPDPDKSHVFLWALSTMFTY